MSEPYVRLEQDRHLFQYLFGIWYDIAMRELEHNDVNIVFFCQQGRHRSVACAELLARCVREAGGKAGISDINIRLCFRLHLGFKLFH